LFSLLLSRVGSALVVVLGVCTLVFLLIHLIPGDPVEAMLGESAQPSDREALRAVEGSVFRAGYPAEAEAVLLGSAMLGAVAAGPQDQVAGRPAPAPRWRRGVRSALLATAPVDRAG